MGLDDLVDRLGEQGGKEEENSSKREYVNITIEEFREFFDERDEKWTELTHPGGEVCFATRDYAPKMDDYVLVVFTTIGENSGINRDKGDDAIRNVIWYLPHKRPSGGREKTLRITTWRKNLSKKLDHLMKKGAFLINECDECGAPMVERDGEYGNFLGCTRYPDCQNTEQIE